MSDSHLVFLILPANQSNYEWLKRLSLSVLIARFCENDERELIKQSDAFESIDLELISEHWHQAVTCHVTNAYSNDGSSHTHFGGHLRLTNDQWKRLQSWISKTPLGFYYFRFDERTNTIKESTFKNHFEILKQQSTWQEAIHGTCIVLHQSPNPNTTQTQK